MARRGSVSRPACLPDVQVAVVGELGEQWRQNYGQGESSLAGNPAGCMAWPK
jgi:hypothetical protein